MIEWQNRTITGKSGKIYRIEPEAITAGRWPEYELQSLNMAFNADFKNLYVTLHELSKNITEAKTIGDVNKISIKIDKILYAITLITENTLPKVVKFCGIFCNAEGEDTSTYTETIIRDKYEDWKHIPIQDFFLLVSEVIPLFKDAYRYQKLQNTTEI